MASYSSQPSCLKLSQEFTHVFCSQIRNTSLSQLCRFWAIIYNQVTKQDGKLGKSCLILGQVGTTCTVQKKTKFIGVDILNNEFQYQREKMFSQTRAVLQCTYRQRTVAIEIQLNRIRQIWIYAYERVLSNIHYDFIFMTFEMTHLCHKQLAALLQYQ